MSFDMNEADAGARKILCRSLTAENFSPFGQVIDANGVEPETINDGTSRRYSELAALDFNVDAARPKISLYVANARCFPLRIAKLERHLQSTQVFIPLGMQRFTLVVALGGDSPDPESVTAFLTSPGQGISLHRGTWHHGLIALGDGDRFAVIDGGNYRTDTQEHALSRALWLEHPQGRQ